MSRSIQSLLSLDENEGLFFVETTPIDIPSSPELIEEPKKPADTLVQAFKTNGRYFERPNPLIKCYNCNQYGHMSGTCPNPSYKFRCSYCGESGHTAFSCIQIICHKCMGVGHKINQCRSDPNHKCRECKRPNHKARNCLVREDILSKNEELNVTCYMCREIGHASCFQLKDKSKDEFCAKCGEQGHIIIDCRRERN
ncbi:hypothetical protein SteCoe_22331 [Stentor coeruleus]|uniref:CCHC-type domain-containing protein n=1 Tax=Stentor coeruleus TaxID=5963 RepID=A0A1R2BMH1_9CILI|nr:hypothetical protein SteCoe_22331 [Stentor coeruleus]